MKIGDNTKIGSNVLIKDFSDIGSNCNIFNGAVIGELPMDLKFEGEKSKKIVGNNTKIRENNKINIFLLILIFKNNTDKNDKINAKKAPSCFDQTIKFIIAIKIKIK